MKTWTLAALLPCAVLIACGRAEAPGEAAVANAPGASAAVTPGTYAQVNLAGASGTAVKGVLQLTAEGGEVMVVGQLSGLEPGTEHGFHAHEKGDCSAPDAASAGEHFNPAHANHGGPTASEKHLGDLPNVQADNEGNATVYARVAGATLRDGGAHDLVGKAFIVHARRDDYITQPSGDSGDRIACGVVQ